MLGTSPSRTIRFVHIGASLVALATLLMFWTTTVWSELSSDPARIAAVKSGIAFGLLVLVPSMAAVGITGMRLAGVCKGRLIETKRRRMKVIMAVGVGLLVPAALLLAWLSRSALGPAFYSIQLIELAAGATNITLIGLNFRDGLRMSGRLRKRSAPRS